ncbi:DNA-processing protein DprA [Amycolatopsis sp. NPDC059021]|uniref:DNA-processing protein DprA n=1 Tax=Amycolatopsis sp. NPDC059021 TaxID=3346704 RepID=UPI00366D0549
MTRKEPGSIGSRELGADCENEPRLGDLDTNAVAVVGTLAASPYGEHVADDLGRDLARRGITVINGAGYGIEGEALRGAVSASGPGRCVIVLPCGIDVEHPARHGPLRQDIIESGGFLVSEYPLGMRPRRARVHARQRLVAALSGSTVVVEAGRRSPALAVARAACTLGRRVYAVPGPVTAETSAGTNELLRTRVATVITCARDLTTRSLQ